jgi:hypothetical protein
MIEVVDLIDKELERDVFDPSTEDLNLIDEDGQMVSAKL